MSAPASTPNDWWKDFVGATPARTAKLAVVAKDGRPLVAPVWVALDGDDLMLTTAESTAKGRAIRRDPRVAMCFDDERPPFGFVIVHGTAEIIDDGDQLRQWAAIIGGRYMGEDRAAEYGERNAVPGELLVRVTPTKVIAAQNLAD